MQETMGSAQPAQSPAVTVSLLALGSVGNLAKGKLCGAHIEKNPEFSFSLRTVSTILENQIKFAHFLETQLGTMDH